MKAPSGSCAATSGRSPRCWGLVAGGDLTVEPEQNYIGDFSSIKTSMEAIIAKLGDTMAQIVSSAEQVSAGADQMSSNA